MDVRPRSEIHAPVIPFGIVEELGVGAAYVRAAQIENLQRAVCRVGEMARGEVAHFFQ